MTTTHQKNEVRARMKSLIKECPINELNTFSKKISAQLMTLIREKKWRTIGLFAPLQSEPSIWPVFEELKLDFYFPRVNFQNILEFVQIKNQDQLTEENRGIREPATQLPAIDSSLLDVILVPGMAFDQAGNRLGRGKGFYDKFFHDTPKKIIRIGVCFPFQILEQVPVEERDQPVDQVITGY
ncbi:MAG: 5-formyltetrahydrofolate cyclo-ligase [Patescibacteria group bacterium]